MEVLRLFRERRFVDAAALVEPALRSGEGIGRITGLRAPFGDSLAESEVFFRRVFETLDELRAVAAPQAAQNLADVPAGLDRFGGSGGIAPAILRSESAGYAGLAVSAIG
jgi:hypothetical protein